MKSAEATWSYDMYVECPECGEYQDINKYNDEQDHPAGYIGDAPRDMNVIEGKEEFVVICEKCECEFCISKVNY